MLVLRPSVPRAIRPIPALFCAASLLAGACQSTRPTPDNPPADASLHSLEPGASSDPARQVGSEQELAQSREATILSPMGLEPRQARRAGDAGVQAPGDSGAAGGAGTAAAATPTAAAAEAQDKPAETPAARIAVHAAELRALLVERAQASTDPLAASIALAAFDAAIDPAAGGTVDLKLSPTEQRTLTIAKDLFARMLQGPGTHGGPARLADLMMDAAANLSKDAGVRISHAALCRRVESFGRFDPFPTASFLAGQTHRAIVYVELDRFATREMTSSDSMSAEGGRWTVEVSQELELIHDADGRQQWYRPPQTVSDSSRTLRHDFYLVNTIDLPATLTVGAYSLKVTIRDRTSGATDERVIPLQVIADPSALQSPRSGAFKAATPPTAAK